MNAARWRPSVQGGLLGLLGVTALLYAPALQCWFSSWDDLGYIYGNPLIVAVDWRHLTAMWSVHHHPHYIPLTVLSYAIDFQCWGMQAAGYHATSILWHLVNVWLVYTLLRATGIRAAGAWWGGACFALHPLQVESVVWLSERNNLLSTAGIVASLICYLRSGTPPTAGRAQRSWWAWGVAIGGAAMLTKRSAMLLPVLCVIGDRWVRRRSWRQALQRSSPFWVMAVLGGVVTLWAEQSSPLAHAGRLDGLGATLLTWPRLWTAYLRMVVWPQDLSVWYAFDVSHRMSDGRVWGAVAVMGGVGWLLWRWQRHQPRVLWWTCWCLAPLAALLPALHVWPVHPWMHDRYFYVPLIGVCGLIGEGIAQLAARTRDTRRLSWCVIGLAGLALVMLGARTAARARLWRDPVALWSEAVRRAPRAALPRVLLGDALVMAGRHDEATRMQWSAADVEPDARVAWAVRGLLLQRRDDRSGAQAAYRRAHALDPGGLQHLLAQGDAAYERGDWPSALEAYGAVVQRRRVAHAMTQIARVAQHLGRADQAVVWYRRALRQQPWRADLHEQMAETLIAQGLPAEAARARAAAAAWRWDYQRLAAAHRRAAAQYARWGWRTQAVWAAGTATTLEPPAATTSP